MKKYSKIYFLLFTLYITIYKLLFTSNNELLKYIINPIIFIIFSIVGYYSIYLKNNKYYQYEKDNIYIIIISSLVYMFLFFILGFFTSFSNSPYFSSTSGIVINLFSIILVIALKEFIRGIVISDTNKKYIYIFIFIIFVISDLNFNFILGLIKNINNLFILLTKYILPVLSLNLFNMYLCKNSGFKPSLIFMTLISISIYIVPITPKVDYIIITLFNTLIPLFTYLSISHNIRRKNKLEITEPIKPYKWIITFTMTVVILLFSLGVFPTKLLVILTGSMKPTINEGDLVIISKCNINNVLVGDIVLYKINNYEVIHRVVKVIKNNGRIELIMKGDNNLKEDALRVDSESLVGCYLYHLPYLGYPAYFFRKIVSNSDVSIETGK